MPDSDDWVNVNPLTCGEAHSIKSCLDGEEANLYWTISKIPAFVRFGVEYIILI